MSKKVMVIDDDQGIREFLIKALEARQMQVEAVERGVIGLQRLLKGGYDLALIDINMPEVTGPAICSTVRQQDQTAELPVVMMTAMFHSADQIAQAKQDYGATEFLLKPFKVEDLYQLLDTLFPPAVTAADRTPMSGQLGAHTLPMLLNQLYAHKLTGLLNLQHEGTKKVIYFKGGYPIFARSNILQECLGQMLVKDAVITQEDCDRSIEQSRQTKRLQGTALIEMGLLTPEELHEALTRQVTEKLLNVFAWDTGEYQFTAARTFKKNVTEIELSPAALILQGISRFWTAKRIDEYLEPYRQAYLIKAENPLFLFQKMGLSRRGEEVFEECLGDLTLEQILQHHPLSRIEIQQVLAALLLSGMVSANAAAAVPDEEALERRRKDHPQQNEELRKKILDDYNRILQADYYEALGVARQSSPEEVRRAYYRMAKECHPDRFVGLGLSPDMEEKVNDIFKFLTHAYTVLTDKEASANYLDELVNGPKAKTDVSRVIEAEMAYQKGLTLLKVRRYEEAAEYLLKAVEASDKEPEYLTQYAWSLYKADPTRPSMQEKALKLLVTSREINPRLEDTHVYLGHVYRALNKTRQSEKSFELAVQINPRCTEALRELRLINLRKEQSGDGSLLKKFLGKKKS